MEDQVRVIKEKCQTKKDGLCWFQILHKVVRDNFFEFMSACGKV